MMTGFDPAFATPEDYIIGITHQIWEGRDLASLHSYYAPDLPVRSPSGVVSGTQGVIAATLASSTPSRITASPGLSINSTAISAMIWKPPVTNSPR